MIKIKSLTFKENKFRKLKNIKIEFADRITLIAGHNGIGKSTILSLIASASGLPGYKSYFNRPFSVDINEIAHLDPSELVEKKLAAPWPLASYVDGISGLEHWKNITITKRPDRLKSVPRTDKDSPDSKLSGPDAKVPVPTIYLGMVRMLPIGESSAELVSHSSSTIDSEDGALLRDFISKVILGSAVLGSSDFTEQSIENTKKTSQHPRYGHTSKSVSLGQDSLSSIATAIVSFNKLKRELGGDYQGGMLVIDEIDAGLHPHAQQRMIDALASAARRLDLQIIATTHSSGLVEYVHPQSTLRDNHHRIADKVIYFTDTTSPRLPDWSLKQILSDMSLAPIVEDKKSTTTFKAYLEDDQAARFLKGILGMKTDYKTFAGKERRRLQIVPIGVGGSNIVSLPNYDDYFKKILLIVDADTSIPKKTNNAIKLPAQYPETGAKGKGFNPEKTIYTYLQDLALGDDSKYRKTYNALVADGVTTDRIRMEFLASDVSIDDRDSSKRWFKSAFEKLMEYRLLRYWAEDHEVEMNRFMTELKSILSTLEP